MNNTKISLPQGFCYADECGFSCLTDAKYATDDNFTGRQVLGYNAPFVVLSVSLSDALKRAAEIFLKMGLQMKFYDAYRPQRSVNAFAAWALDISDTLQKETHYPHIKKEDLFELGYIAKRSGHTRGCAVDLTLVQKETLYDLDMGTHFDFMDPLSWHGAKGLTNEQNKNRTLLKDTMLKCGFRINPMEWWHYALIEEPFPDTYFDFEIGSQI
jgi:D-alanyl-D-alanine dipeptidase